jgi:CheY-like chemotaxis protein
MSKGRILVVDDDEMLRRAVRRYLEQGDYDVRCTDTAESALLILAGEQGERGWIPDLVVTDWEMPHMKGDEFCRIAHQDYPHLPVILTSADERVLWLFDTPAVARFVKPYSMEDLRVQIAARLAAPWQVVIVTDPTAHGAPSVVAVADVTGYKIPDIKRMEQALTAAGLSGSFYKSMDTFEAAMTSLKRLADDSLRMNKHNLRKQALAKLTREECEALGL